MYERRGAGKLSSDEIVEQLKKFKDVRLTAGERLFLWLLGALRPRTASWCSSTGATIGGRSSEGCELIRIG